MNSYCRYLQNNGQQGRGIDDAMRCDSFFKTHGAMRCDGFWSSKCTGRCGAMECKNPRGDAMRWKLPEQNTRGDAMRLISNFQEPGWPAWPAWPAWSAWPAWPAWPESCSFLWLRLKTYAFQSPRVDAMRFFLHGAIRCDFGWQITQGDAMRFCFSKDTMRCDDR